MNVDLNIVMPQVFDIVHVGLAATVVILVLGMMICRCCRSSCAVNAESVSKEDVDEPKSELKKVAQVQLQDMDGKGALQLLSILQNESRLVDFIREDVAPFSDEEVGAAVRVVHKGLRKAFDDHFTVEPIISQEEGDAVVVETGFKPQEVQLLGQVSGDGPFKGVLVHQGWRVTDVRLPKMVEGRDSFILASAQVEL